MGDYYQGIVVEYLRADRSMFVNTECCIQLNPGENPDTTGPHWYCDAVTADFSSKTVFLCEVSYAHTLQALKKRLEAWNENWDGVCKALARDCRLPIGEWGVRPWLFIPHRCVKTLRDGLENVDGMPLRFMPRITPLEMVQPWEYCSYNRIGEKTKPDCVPDEWRG